MVSGTVSKVELHFGAATDVGRVRHHNEDSHLAEPPVFVVADGMGGHQGGEVASGIVVEEFAKLAATGFDRSKGAEVVSATLQAAQGRIEEYGAGRRRPGRPWYAGTTVVAALLVEDAGTDKWLLVNLGDSRIYRLVEGRLDQISVDHSVVQELMDAGMLTRSDAARHPERHVITKAVGGPTLPEPDFFLLPLSAAERLVLVSDGVSGLLDDPEIAEILTAAPDPRDAADRLVRAAVEAGGTDNATAVVVDVVGLARDAASFDTTQQQQTLEKKLGALP